MERPERAADTDVASGRTTAGGSVGRAVLRRRTATFRPPSIPGRVTQVTRFRSSLCGTTNRSTKSTRRSRVSLLGDRSAGHFRDAEDHRRVLHRRFLLMRHAPIGPTFRSITRARDADVAGAHLAAGFRPWSPPTTLRRAGATWILQLQPEPLGHGQSSRPAQLQERLPAASGSEQTQ